MFFKRLITTERFHIMVDIPEKMIDNSRHIIKYMVLQVCKNTQQIVRKAVEVNKRDGMEWTYVGPQEPTDSLYIPTYDKDDTEIILFKMK